MKLGFLADIHIKLAQKNVPIEWAKNRYQLLIEAISDYDNSVDMWVLGGDIWDKHPSVEEMEIFFDMIWVLNKPTFIFSGNHEAAKKNTTFLSNLSTTVNRFNRNVTIIDYYYSIDNIDFIPYNKLKEFEKNGHDFEGNILCTHVRGEISPHVKPEVDLSIFDRWDVVLAGDLHSYDNCQRNILYPGSPLTTSFHRSVVDTGFIILDTETLEHEWIKLKLPQLIRKTLKAGEEPVATDFHHTIYELEGDLATLGSMEDNELVEKKIVKRTTDTALILEPEMTLETEISEYLKYILQLEDTVVAEILQELNNV